MKNYGAQTDLFTNALRTGVTNTIVFIVTAFAGRIGLLCALPYITAHMSLEEFGIWDWCHTVFVLTSSTISAIASAVLTRFFLCAGNEQERHYAIAHSFCIAAGVGILLIGVLGICAHAMPLYSAVQPYWLWIGFNSLLSAFFTVLLQVWKVQQALYRYVLLYMSNSLLLLASMLFFVHYEYAIQGQLWSTTISLLISVPYVCYIWYSYYGYQRELFIRHVRYGLPLLAYGLLYSCFMYTDRSAVLAAYGLSISGTYALLWRFGVLFQFFSSALMDALPLVIYPLSAHTSNKKLVPDIITVVLLSMAMVATAFPIGISVCVPLLFPPIYMSIGMLSIPFFLFLLLFEMVRTLQIAFHIAEQTWLELIMAAFFVVTHAAVGYSARWYTISMHLNVQAILFLWYTGLVIWYCKRQVPVLCVSYVPISAIICGVYCLMGFMSIALNRCSLSTLILVYVVVWVMVLCIIVLQSAAICQYLIDYIYQSHAQDTCPAMTYHQYSDLIIDTRVVIAGPLPPPYGGVAVHIERLAHKLQQQGNQLYLFDTTLSAYSMRYWIGFVRAVWRARSAYFIHQTPFLKKGIIELLVFCLTQWLLNIRCIIVDHDPRHLHGRSPFFLLLYSIALRRMHSLVTIGEITFDMYKACHIRMPAVVAIESSFMPPPVAQQEARLAQYPAYVHQFFDHYPVTIIMNGFQPLFIDGKDLYGFDVAIRLFDRIKKDIPQVGLCIMCATCRTDAQRAYIQNIIGQSRYATDICFITGPYELWPLFANATLFIRPTRSDSFGISIAEALYCGVPAIASAVCKRPAGTLLYNVDDEHLLHELTHTLILQKQTLLPSAYQHSHAEHLQ